MTTILYAVRSNQHFYSIWTTREGALKDIARELEFEDENKLFIVEVELDQPLGCIIDPQTRRPTWFASFIHDQRVGLLGE